MPNGIKGSLSTTPAGSLRKGSVAIGIGGVGPTSTTDFYSMPTPASGKYVISLANTLGPSNPLFYAPQTDAELINFAKSRGATGANTGSVAAVLAWIATQSSFLAANIEYEGIVTDGLVFNTDAGYVGSYPTTGTTWYDLSGNSRNGTLTNGPTFSTGSNGSIVFDGIDDYVSINTAIGNAIATTSTVSFWIYRTTTFNTSNTAVGQFLYGQYTDNSNRGIVYFASDSGYVGTLGSLLVSGGSITGRVYTQQNSWSPGWYNIVFTRTASSYKIYVNGVDMPLTTVVNNATIAYPSNPTYTLLGANFFSSLNVYGYYPGYMANALFYNKVLTAAEVTQNYNAQKGRFGL